MTEISAEGPPAFRAAIRQHRRLHGYRAPAGDTHATSIRDCPDPHCRVAVRLIYEYIDEPDTYYGITFHLPGGEEAVHVFSRPEHRAVWLRNPPGLLPSTDYDLWEKPAAEI
jgi:hypothetical protein